MNLIKLDTSGYINQFSITNTHSSGFIEVDDTVISEVMNTPYDKRAKFIDGSVILEDKPTPTIVYVSASQRKIVDALKGMELWATFRPYIHADEDRYDAFYLSQEIRIDDKFILDAIADPTFALTAELAQDIIDAANL